MRLAIMAIGAALALAGCTARSEMQASQRAQAETDLAKALDGRVAGTPVDCISDDTPRGPQVIDRDTILYHDGRRVWRNELAAECPSLNAYDTLIVEKHGSQLCRNDRFRVLPAGTRIPGPYCRLGSFTPYTRP
jgi:hypothetical protein